MGDEYLVDTAGRSSCDGGQGAHAHGLGLHARPGLFEYEYGDIAIIGGRYVLCDETNRTLTFKTTYNFFTIKARILATATFYKSHDALSPELRKPSPFIGPSCSGSTKF